MAKTREIRRRIRSITSTRKVTKAMELVASAKMRRAVAAIQSARGYAELAWQLLQNVAARTEGERHPLLRRTDGGRTGVVVVTSNRGLVGSFNAQLITAVLEFTKTFGTNDADVILVGRKGRAPLTRGGMNLSAAFEKLDIITDIEHVRPIATVVLQDFLSGKLNRVVLAYTDFRSTLVQKPVVRQILPIEVPSGIGSTEYRFEPDPELVLAALLPRLLEVQMYRALLESTASEHAARMVAMRNASDAADDLISDLTLAFNQARQQSITQDLAEISSGAAVLTANQ